MTKHSKRILLDSLDLINLSSQDSSEPTLPDTDLDPYALPSLAPKFSFNKNALPGYGTALPVSAVDFTFPAEDQKRVEAWFTGDFSHVTQPESATLKKNMAAAVKSTLDSFISTALSRNLFPAPFLLGWQYRLFDGSIAKAEAAGSNGSPKAEAAGSNDGPKAEAPESNDSPKAEAAGSHDSPRAEAAGSNDSPKAEAAGRNDSAKAEAAGGNDSAKAEAAGGNDSAKAEAAGGKGASIIPMLPLSSAPDLIIRSYNIYEKAIHSDIVFSQYPGQLLLNIPIPERGEDFRDIITAIEFFITKPVPLYPIDMTVSGVRSISIDGIRERVWQYSSYDSDTLLAIASSDSDFRIVASIPFSDILDGKYSSDTPLPIEAGALSRFSSLPKQSASLSGGSGNSSSGSSGGFNGTDGWRPYLHVATPPLDLSLPETEKSVTDIYLRGVFQRNEVKLTLYGSHHREHWRMIARSHSPYIRGIRRAPFRWLKVEMELPMRRDDFLEALFFSFNS